MSGYADAVMCVLGWGGDPQSRNKKGELPCDAVGSRLLGPLGDGSGKAIER